MNVIEVYKDGSVVEVLPQETPDVLEVATETNVLEVETETPSILDFTNQFLDVVEVISPGPQGPAGSGGGGEDTVDVVAAENIPQFSVVTAKGNVADSSNLSHYAKVVGIAPLSVTSGNTARLKDEGELTNNLWSWAPGQPLYLNGTILSATAPSTGFSQRVATARNSNIIIVGFGPPILL